MSPYMQLDFYWFGYKKLLLVVSQIAKSPWIELIQMSFPLEISLWGFLEQKKKKKIPFLRHSLFYFFLFKILIQNNLHYIHRTFCLFLHRDKMITQIDACSLQQAGWFLSTYMALVCLIYMESFYFIPHFKS